MINVNNNEKKRVATSNNQLKKEKGDINMKQNKKYIVAVGLGLLCGLYVFVSPVMGAGKTYVMSGKVTAVDTAYNTVVIDVPLGKEMFTVAGPLSPKAVLRKGGKPAHLTDFMVGESVKVKWQATDEGHLITALEAK